MKLSFATFLIIISLVLGCALLESSMAMADTGDCGTKCGTRCALAGYKDRCLKYCGICCQKCSCVPSGTSGNKSECPCYNNMLNPKGKSKCP